MKTLNFLTLLLIAGTIGLSSCKKDEDKPTEETTETTLKTNEVTLSRTTNYGEDWVYFSFETNAEVSGIDTNNYKTSNKWDIAFNRNNVRTNSGLSGIGEGGVYDAGKVEFSSITKANESGYIADSNLYIVAGFNPDHSPIMLKTTGNSTFTGCIKVVMGQQGPTYPTNDHIYVIKTTNGKYAKILIKGFYNDNGDSGYVNFKYSYQANGSTTLE